MTKQHYLRDGWECARSVAGRIRLGRKIDTYSSEEKGKEEKYIYIYRYMVAY